MISANQGGSFFAPLQNYSRGAAAHRGAIGAFPRGGFANQQGEHAPGGFMHAIESVKNDGTVVSHPTPSVQRGRGYSDRGNLHGGINHGGFSQPQIDNNASQDGMNDMPSFNNQQSQTHEYFSRGGNGRGAFAGPQNHNNVFGNASGSRGTFSRGSGTRGQFSFHPPQNVTEGGMNYVRGSFSGGGLSRGNSTSFQSLQNSSSAFGNGHFRGRGSGGNSFPLGNRGGSIFGNRGGSTSGSANIRPLIHDNNEKENVKTDLDGEAEREKDVPRDLPTNEEDKEIYGEDIQTTFADKKLPQSRADGNFEPILRDINAIYEEDIKHADEYAAIYDEDDQVIVEGLHGQNLTEIEEWDDACFFNQLKENIARTGYIHPRKIQRSVIPLILEGYNLKVQAETGTGKSAAFLLPIIHKCFCDKKDEKFQSKAYVPYAVILSPTRELAMQSYEQASKFVYGTGITVAKAYGDYSCRSNIHELAGTCDILCATPGRFLDFVQQRKIILNETKFLVFDEGDHLLSPSFKRTIDDALFDCGTKIATEHQTLFFSATFDSYALSTANQYMRYGKTVSIKNKSVAPSKKCIQEFVLIEKFGKFRRIFAYFKSELAKVGNNAKLLPRTFIFCQKSLTCEKVAIGLEQAGIPVIPLSGIRAQNLREEAIREFRDNNVSVLTVTDIASRGIDIKDVDVVINFDMPLNYTTYVHRVGRAGRIRNGKSFSFVVPESDGSVVIELKKAMEAAGHEIPQSLNNVIDQCIIAASEFQPTGFGNGFKKQTNATVPAAVNKSKEAPSAAVVEEKVGDITSSATLSNVASTVESADKNDKVGENDNIDVNAPTVEIIKEEKPAEAIDMVDKVQIPSNEVSLQDENGCESAAAVNLDDISDKVEKSVDADKKEEEMIVEIVGASTVTADRAETIGVKVEEIKSADKNDKVEEIGNIDDVNAPTVEVVKEEKPAVAIVIVDKVQLPSNEVSLQDENGCKSAAAVNLDEKSVDADKHEEEMLVEGVTASTVAVDGASTIGVKDKAEEKPKTAVDVIKGETENVGDKEVPPPSSETDREKNKPDGMMESENVVVDPVQREATLMMLRTLESSGVNIPQSVIDAVVNYKRAEEVTVAANVNEETNPHPAADGNSNIINITSDMNHEIAAPRADKNVENVANEKDANPPPSVSRDDKKGNGEISVQKIDEDQKKPSDAIKDVEEEDDDDDGW